MENPEFIIFTGPMFGSKTTRLLATVERYNYQNKLVIAFKPDMDDRYSHDSIRTHSGGQLKAKIIKSGDDVIDVSNEYQPDIVAVDEAFMIPGISNALIKLFKDGKTIVVSSLQLSASGNVFKEIRDIMPWATKIEICPAVCPITGRDAFYTYKKINDDQEIAVGGAEMYEPRCWEYTKFIQKCEVI